MNRLKLLLPYFLLAGLAVVLVVTNIPDDEQPTHAMPQPARLDGAHIDVVCHMEVNPAWGIQSGYEDRTFYFCTDFCKKLFDDDPERWVSLKCLVCKRPLSGSPMFPATYLGKTYELCSQAHRVEFKADPAGYFMHTMWGIPIWLYYGSIGLVLVLSFGVFDLLSRGSGTAQTPPRAKQHRPVRISREAIKGDGERLFGAVGPGALQMDSIAAPAAVSESPCTNFQGTRAAGFSLRESFGARVLQRCARSYRQAQRILGVRPRWISASDRFDLLSVGALSWAARSRVFRFASQMIVVALFALIVAAGLFGNQNPAMNIAPILTWTVWWGLLIVLILYAGKAWCYVCPWDAVAGWLEKLAFWRKVDDGLTLGLRWPRIIRNISIATILFVGLTWIELGFGVTMKPRVTAYLAIAMLVMAIGSAMLFDRKSFCRYGCLVGRVSGLYALFGGAEVRAKDGQVCRACRTKECIKGSDTAYGCPTFLYPGGLQTNTYCILCMECIQACPSDNLAVNLRPWGGDLALEGKPRADEAYLALLMLSITGFHGLTMTPLWQQMIDAMRGAAGVGRILGFTIGMALLMLGPIAVYAVLVAASQRLGQGRSLRPLTYRDYFIRYAYALLPIALFYHIAHNAEHLLMEGPKVVALASDPFGWGWNLLGTGTWVIPPLISLDKLWLVQVLLVLIGHVYSLWVAQKTSLRLFGSPKAAFRSQLPMLVGMIGFSVFSLWLLKQPMEMRTSAM